MTTRIQPHASLAFRLNPKGIASTSPGLPELARATLGPEPKEKSTPTVLRPVLHSRVLVADEDMPTRTIARRPSPYLHERSLPPLAFHLSAGSTALHLDLPSSHGFRREDPVVGRWKTIQTSCVLVLSADGKAHQYKVNFSMRGKWECIDDKGLTRKYRVNWENGLHVYEWRLEKDGDKLHGKDGKVIANRIKE